MAERGLSPVRIAVIDDDQDILVFMKRALEARGHEVFTFTNPGICPLQRIRECRCKANEKCVDLIITDIDMPEMNGFKFLEQHLSKDCHCRDVCIVTGRLGSYEVAKAAALSCKAFCKPLQLEKLFIYVDSVAANIPATRRLRDWFLEVIPQAELQAGAALPPRSPEC